MEAEKIVNLKVEGPRAPTLKPWDCQMMCYILEHGKSMNGGTECTSSGYGAYLARGSLSSASGAIQSWISRSTTSSSAL